MKNRIIFFISAVFIISAIFAGYCIFDMSRTDSTPPRITMDEGLLTVSVADDETALLQGIYARDQKDGDVTASILVENVFGIDADGCATVTYAAFDSAGNVSKAQRSVCFSDYTAPRFTASRSLAVPAGSGAASTLFESVGAVDVIDGNITRRMRFTLVSDTGSLSDVGVHDVRLTVTNSMGDTSELLIPVEVYQTGKYNASLVLDSYMLYLERGSKFRAEEHLQELSYYNETISLRGQLPEGIDCEISGTVLSNSPGVYPVRYNVTWTDGGNEYSGYAMLIVVIV